MLAQAASEAEAALPARAGGAALLTDLGLGPALRDMANPMQRVLARTVRTCIHRGALSPQSACCCKHPALEAEPNVSAGFELWQRATAHNCWRLHGGTVWDGAACRTQVNGRLLVEIDIKRAVKGHEADLVRNGEVQAYTVMRCVHGVYSGVVFFV